MVSCISQDPQCLVKRKQSRSKFELVMSNSFPSTITVLPRDIRVFLSIRDIFLSVLNLKNIILIVYVTCFILCAESRTSCFVYFLVTMFINSQPPSSCESHTALGKCRIVRFQTATMKWSSMLHQHTTTPFSPSPPKFHVADSAHIFKVIKDRK